MIDRALIFVPLLLICSNARLSAFEWPVKLQEHVRSIDTTSRKHAHSVRQHFHTKHRTRLIFSHSNKSENELELVNVDEPSNNNNELPNDVLDEMMTGQPTELVIMKDVRYI